MDGFKDTMKNATQTNWLPPQLSLYADFKPQFSYISSFCHSLFHFVLKISVQKRTVVAM